MDKKIKRKGGTPTLPFLSGEVKRFGTWEIIKETPTRIDYQLKGRGRKKWSCKIALCIQS